jgi:hypothetical protein
MSHVCKHSTERVYSIIKENQVFANRNTPKMLPGRGRRSGKERTRIK